MYASGAVRLALGDVLLDVGLGTEAGFRQDLALVSAEDGECTFLGGVHTRAVACPDVAHLLGCARRTRACNTPKLLRQPCALVP